MRGDPRGQAVLLTRARFSGHIARGMDGWREAISTGAAPEERDPGWNIGVAFDHPAGVGGASLETFQRDVRR